MTRDADIEPDRAASKWRRRIHLSAVVLVALALVGGAGAWFAFQAIQHRQFRAEREQIESVLETWRTPPPAAADPEYWEAAWQTTFNAFGNVCFTENHVSIEQMRLLHRDVKQKNREPQSWERLEWLWQRLAQTGPHGKKYITQMQPLWDDVAP